MGDIGDGDSQSKIDAIVGRIAALAYADERLGMGGPDAELAAELGAALAFLPQLRLGTLRALEKDLARPDSLATGGIQRRGQAGEPGVAWFVVRVCSQTRGPDSSPRPAHAIDASLLDLLMFRDVRLAHGDIMFQRCFTRVKDILGLGSEDSLADHGVARYGAHGIVSLLNISVSLAELQLSQTSAHITAQMGYAGLDAYADAKDDCHFMTAAFARWILKKDPSPAKVAALAADGRLATYGISPAELDPEKLQAEVAKVDVAALAGSLPDVDAGSSHPEHSGSGTSDRPQSRRPDLSELDDGAMRSFDVTIPPAARNPATAGDAFEKHISPKGSNAALQRLKALVWVACPAAVVAISFWMAAPAVGELLGEPGGNAWQRPAVFVVSVALCGGCLIAMGICSWLDLRANGFFLVARELSRFTVLQGRRDEAFLKALRTLRPGLFQHSGTAGLPRLFSLCFSSEGALLIGGGASPGVVAVFPWQTVQEIVPESPVKGRKRPLRRGQRVILTVSHEGADIQLAFPLERAKVAWTSRTFLEAKPLEATLALVQGLRTASLVGPEFHMSAAWQQQPQAPASATYLRRRTGEIARGMVAVALFCAASPFILNIFLR